MGGNPSGVKGMEQSGQIASVERHNRPRRGNFFASGLSPGAWPPIMPRFNAATL